MTTPVPDSYPVEQPEDGATDPRFTFGLLVEFADVLVAHDYPTLSGTDLVELRQTLYRFIYGKRDTK